VQGNHVGGRRRGGRHDRAPRPEGITCEQSADAVEFLQAAKRDAALKRIPVVVLTTSEEQQDKVASFDLGVAGYIRKPVDYRQFVEAVRAIDTYWTLSELPQ